MLSFKQYALQEKVDAQWVASVMDNIVTGGAEGGAALTPLTTGMIKSAFGRIRRITTWHTTSPKLLGKTLSLAGKKKSISTSNAFGRKSQYQPAMRLVRHLSHMVYGRVELY